MYSLTRGFHWPARILTHSLTHGFHWPTRTLTYSLTCGFHWSARTLTYSLTHGFHWPARTLAYSFKKASIMAALKNQTLDKALFTCIKFKMKTLSIAKKSHQICDYMKLFLIKSFI
jgi:hypothetical protein